MPKLYSTFNKSFNPSLLGVNALGTFAYTSVDTIISYSSVTEQELIVSIRVKV